MIYRQKVLELKSPQQSKTSKFLQDAPPRDPISVGIIGCGRIGLHLVNCLQTYADVQPTEIHISTRRPELLGKYLVSLKMLEIFNDSHWPCTVSILFCCLQATSEGNGLAYPLLMICHFKTSLKASSIKVDVHNLPRVFFAFNRLTLTSEMHFVRFHPVVAS